MYVGKNGKKYPCHSGYGDVKIGERYGRVVVIRKGPTIHYKCGDSASTWVCKCDCGNEIVYRADKFRVGNLAYFRCDSCKRNRENIFAKAASILKRCNDPSSQEWPNYGERGIKCELGVSTSEVTDMLQSVPGYQKGYSIDRIDNNGNYTIYHPLYEFNVYDYTDPHTNEVFKARGNLRWVPPAINNLNRRNNITIDNVSMTSRIPSVFRDICKRYGWNYDDFNLERDSKYPYEARYFYYLKDDVKDKYK